jgi:CDP-glucose 4,6-dehydratase
MSKHPVPATVETADPEMFGNCYRGKKVLVTGHTGFKGAWLCQWLLELGADVTGYALRANTSPSLFEILGLRRNMRHIVGDVRDASGLHRCVREHRPEFVFHLAAQALVKTSYAEPLLTYQTNVLGTANLLDAMRHSSAVRAVVVVTSDKCYENREQRRGYREDDPMGGYDPYSSSKGCAELVTAAYRRSFFDPSRYGDTHRVAVASARAGNVIGGGDWADHRLVPDCVRALARQQVIAIRNPAAVRPWQHVLEPLSGYLWLGAKLREPGPGYGRAWNFGPLPGDALPVKRIVELVIGTWGSGKMAVDRGRHAHEAGLLSLNINKARQLLGWRPVYGINRAVELTVDWYRRFYDEGRRPMAGLTIGQINAFCQRAARLKCAYAQRTMTRDQ